MAVSKYETHVEPRLIEVAAWCRDGATDEEIAKGLGVAYSTFREYTKKYPALSAALKESKAIADIVVENALYKRALGYEYKEVTRERIVDWVPLSEGESESGLIVKLFPAKPRKGEAQVKMKAVDRTVVTKVVTKEVQPDVTAQIFWLKNRRPDRWRDKTETAHTISILDPDDIEKPDNAGVTKADG